MRYLRSALYSLITLISVLLIITLIITSWRVYRLTASVPHHPLERVILFTEIGNTIFEIEKRDVGGLTILTLFSNDVLHLLRTEGYEISMAVDNFTPRMAQAVKRLNRAGIPVWVWPLHPFEDGYWLSADNAEKFPALYDRFQRWVSENRLTVKGIMLDMEPTYQDVQLLREAVKRDGILGAIGFLLDHRDRDLYTKAFLIYRDTVLQMQKDGYEVSTFNYAYILDDMLDGDNSIQEMFHIVFVPSDISSYMFYRSFFKDSGLGTGAANVLSYARSLNGGSAALGSYMKPFFSFEHLAEDLRIAARFSSVVHLYNLESLVLRGWLPRLSTVNLETPVDVPTMSALVITLYRTFFFLLDLFTGTSSLYAVPLLGALLVALFLIFYRRAGDAK